MARSWRGDGPGFTIDWAGREWTLALDAPDPGLHAPGAGPMLALAALAARGRHDRTAFAPRQLAGFERHHGRIEATFLPADWSELTVRAAWAPFQDHGIDLEIQVSTRSVGQLRAVEVLIDSALGHPAGDQPRVVTARDRHAAGLSYDGREESVDDLATEPVPRSSDGWTCWDWDYAPSASHAAPAGWQVVMGRPEDVSRRILARGAATTFALFGHDLERGIVLRGRVRALVIPRAPGDEATGLRAIRVAYDAFCQEPPPLTT